MLVKFAYPVMHERISIQDSRGAAEMQSMELANLALDRGISYAVKVLRDEGIETFESCEGGEGHCFPEPVVRFHGNQYAGLLAVSVALNHGLPVYHLRRAWRIIDGELEGPFWEVTFGRDRLFEVQAQAEQAGFIYPKRENRHGCADSP